MQIQQRIEQFVTRRLNPRNFWFHKFYTVLSFITAYFSVDTDVNGSYIIDVLLIQQNTLLLPIINYTHECGYLSRLVTRWHDIAYSADVILH